MSRGLFGREVRLISRPKGMPRESDFEVVELEIEPPGDDEVLVRNTFLSVDPYMRGRMNDVKSYVAPFELGRVMEGGAVGEVVESNAQGLSPGDMVLHMKGWREYAVGTAPEFRRLDPGLAPAPSNYLGVLGMTGLTAWAGMVRVAQLQEGDSVFVSGAAGAVGSLAGQVAKQRGASRVVGSAGSAEKVRYLVEELGFDAAFNYRDAPVAEQLRAAAPEGIDVYFDNVGGDHLEAAIGSLKVHGRIAICGMISQYNLTEPAPAPRNLALVVGKRLTIRGFLVGDHGNDMKEFLAEVGPWLREGRIKAPETVVNGIENAPSAFIGMLTGANTGKMVVAV